MLSLVCFQSEHQGKAFQWKTVHIDGMSTPQWTSHIIYLDVSDLLINNMSALQNLLAFSEKFP